MGLAAFNRMRREQAMREAKAKYEAQRRAEAEDAAQTEPEPIDLEGFDLETADKNALKAYADAKGYKVNKRLGAAKLREQIKAIEAEETGAVDPAETETDDPAEDEGEDATQAEEVEAEGTQGDE